MQSFLLHAFGDVFDNVAPCLSGDIELLEKVLECAAHAVLGHSSVFVLVVEVVDGFFFDVFGNSLTVLTCEGHPALELFFVDLLISVQIGNGEEIVDGSWQAGRISHVLRKFINGIAPVFLGNFLALQDLSGKGVDIAVCNIAIFVLLLVHPSSDVVGIFLCGPAFFLTFRDKLL